MSPRKRHHGDTIDARDFNDLLKERKVPLPWKDSPGDSAMDESLEMALGRDFYEEDEPSRDDEEFEDVLADSPAENCDTESTNDLAGDDQMIVSSERPDPIEDMDTDTSTH